LIERKARVSFFSILTPSQPEWTTVMSPLRYALAACAAACLAGGVAAAQPATPPSDNAPATSPDQATPPPPEQTTPQPPTRAETATPATSQGVNTVVTVDANGARHLLIFNSPVPDTPENRAKYGAPLSNAGRHTKPAGN
jgi:hypothetical protein